MLLMSHRAGAGKKNCYILSELDVKLLYHQLYYAEILF